jgi:hypothetical protein
MRTVSDLQARPDAPSPSPLLPAVPTRRIAVLLVVAVLVVVGPIVARATAQPASRYALTAALVERHSVDIHGYRLGVDHAIYEGRWRSDKAPGQPLLAVPFFAAGRVLGLDPAAGLHMTGDLGLWWMTFWSSTVPLAALAAMMFLTARRFAPRAALPATLASVFATLLFPYGAVLYGHCLAAAFAFGGWLAVDRAQERARARRWLLLGGLLLAAAIAVEYHVAIVAVAVACIAARRHGRAAGWLAVGAVPPMLATALYQWIAFGRPWRLPYAYYAGVINGTSEGGYKIPSPSQVLDVFTGTNGLLLLTPLTVVAIGAAVMCARRGGETATHAVLALAVTGMYVVMIAGWSGTPIAEDPGPRYLIPALPFLAVPLAVAWERLSRVAVLAAIAGGLMMALATFTDMLVGIGQPRLDGYLDHVRAHAFSQTLWSIGFGDVGTVCYVASVVAVGALLVRGAQQAALHR